MISVVVMSANLRDALAPVPLRGGTIEGDGLTLRVVTAPVGIEAVECVEPLGAFLSFACFRIDFCSTRIEILVQAVRIVPIVTERNLQKRSVSLSSIGQRWQRGKRK